MEKGKRERGTGGAGDNTRSTKRNDGGWANAGVGRGQGISGIDANCAGTGRD
ncbi:hypothetical protein BCR44DRAFT_65106 [Catenaria anguillulae PL171]|uniref:Uncharacterized protein n=1 Tax=Catenaria anguillulae PL171 TaxID=765915 RepID=A0A1Y2HQZ1_9FUNG|nr:hypothetical protein BCR44DRAFT_65106 [Catenaria anguillulae PL171]